MNDVSPGDVSSLLDDLNPAQREAVSAPLGNMLVLAGAGSGKTRVLVHRIAWLMQVERLSPYAILAVTFTNKAAREMRTRLEALLGLSLRNVWVGTFHSIAHRLLRTHWQDARLPQHFQIIDSDDQLRLIKRLIKDHNIDDERYPPRQVMYFISSCKEEGLRPHQVQTHGDAYMGQMVELYERYQLTCERGGLVDFGELLLRSLELLRDNPRLLAHYRERFAHLLVDEFQDTNTLQYAWLKLLAGDRAGLTVVGDDDQSIYGWRGARVENIRRFEQEFPNTRTVRLEQNYRSTSAILDAANTLISHNAGRMGKELWTAGAKGEPISVYAGFNDLDEARFIVDTIKEKVDEGVSRRDIAILYRSNAQSRVIEETLIRQGMPYRIYGGQRFYERLEIKNALAYLRLLLNREDDASLERVINVPARGIGTRTVEILRERARDQGVSLWQALHDSVSDGTCKGRAGNALTAFANLIERLDNDTAGMSLHEIIDHVNEVSGLVEHHRSEKGEKGQARVENLEELVTAARAFTQGDVFELPEAGEGMAALEAFLAEAALNAGDHEADEFEDGVQLMTLHSAKGLEFPVVFIAGVEEGLFPHKMSMEEPGRLEEERRLCYVGVTRAMHKLYLTYAELRRLHGKETFQRASRFLRELPEELLEEVRLRGQVSRPVTATRPGRGLSQQSSVSPGGDLPSLSLGQRVSHPLFGEGIILNAEGEGERARVQVSFEGEGDKWLVLGFAKLTPL
ncbi:DNA helicase II [Halomonas sp. McH1-25]|uniref:DNA helicase II n=1 Tax=unclassified Halomonas TaxID=2609666 RepID=UPI001EF4545A|nr:MULTISPECIES: DNA helicase II [unclassified Halomonas]MCG7599663.1 DNA helicase II [Halomonas sp. McH1-25]MCP1342583.1 DNA helicase II [Halomonas sp. FL8]MCP1363546.1 DNA helicase II [Halomonas sp. BBD45]MCP1365466.1 DNA helicase II [Halomonas sp. BBD48]